MIHILIRKNKLDAALRLIAQALINDKTGKYRERLSQRQAEILARFDHLRQQRSQMLVDRFSRKTAVGDRQIG